MFTNKKKVDWHQENPSKGCKLKEATFQHLRTTFAVAFVLCAFEWLGWWETPWIYMAACDFKRGGWHLNGLVVGASGGGFVFVQGEPRKVGTLLVPFPGPTGYHRSVANSEFLRDKDRVWERTTGTLGNESIRRNSARCILTWYSKAERGPRLRL